MISPSTLKFGQNQICAEYRQLTYLSAVADYTLLGSSIIALQAIAESNDTLGVPSLSVPPSYFLTLYLTLSACVLVPDIGVNYQFPVPLTVLAFGTTYAATNQIKIDGAPLQKTFSPQDISAQIDANSQVMDFRLFDASFSFDWSNIYAVGLPAGFDPSGPWQVQAFLNARLIASPQWPQ